MTLKNKMDLAGQIAIGSSRQVALIVTLVWPLRLPYLSSAPGRAAATAHPSHSSNQRVSDA